jgi:hypothetical protein
VDAGSANSYGNNGVRDGNPGVEDGEQLGIGWGASIYIGSGSVGKMKLPRRAHLAVTAIEPRVSTERAHPSFSGRLRVRGAEAGAWVPPASQVWRALLAAVVGLSRPLGVGPGGKSAQVRSYSFLFIFF